MNRITIILTALGTLIAESLGGWDMWLQTLVFATAIDYLTGVIAAGCRGELASHIGFRGIAKKVAIFVVVTVACRVAEVTAIETIRTVTIMYYIANELLSVLENTVEIGIDVPEPLKKILKKMRDSDEDDKK